MSRMKEKSREEERVCWRKGEMLWGMVGFLVDMCCSVDLVFGAPLNVMNKHLPGLLKNFIKGVNGYVFNWNLFYRPLLFFYCEAFICKILSS